MAGNLIEWSPDMSVGIEALDADHKQLVHYLNCFIQAVDNNEGTFAIEAVFSDLLRYTEEHFEREEGVMEVCGYPDLDAHRSAHAQMAEKILGCRHRYILNPEKALEGEVRDFLMQWLREHILKCDMDYREVVGKHKGEALAELAEE